TAPLVWVAWPDISTGVPTRKPPTLTKKVTVPSWLSSILGTWLYPIDNPFSDMCVLGKVPERFPGPRKVAFAPVEIKGLGSCGTYLGSTAGRSRGVSQIEQGIGMRVQLVRLCRKRHRRGREFHRFGLAATVGENPGRQSLADDLGGDVLIWSNLLAYRDQLGG